MNKSNGLVRSCDPGRMMFIDDVMFVCLFTIFLGNHGGHLRAHYCKLRNVMGHWQDNLERYLQLLTVHRTSTQMDRQSAALREGMECLDMYRCKQRVGKIRSA